MRHRHKAYIESLEWSDLGVRVVRSKNSRGYRLSVEPNSTVEIKTPISWSFQRICKVLDENKSWIEKSLKKASELQDLHRPLSMSLGERVLLLGEERALSFAPSSLKKVSLEIQGSTLAFLIPQDEWREGFESYPHPKLHKNLRKFYDKKAQEILPGLFWATVSRVGYGPNTLSLRNQKTLWGSCSRHRSAIQLNKKLIAAPFFVIEYVIIHELAHLKHSNHGKRFWKEVESHCPDFKRAVKWLSNNHYLFSFLEESPPLYSSPVG